MLIMIARFQTRQATATILLVHILLIESAATDIWNEQVNDIGPLSETSFPVNPLNGHLFRVLVQEVLI